MRVEINSDEQRVELNEIQIGDIFKYEGKYYRRIENLESFEVTAIFIKTGQLMQFTQRAKLVKLINDAKLVIYDYE